MASSAPDRPVGLAAIFAAPPASDSATRPARVTSRWIWWALALGFLARLAMAVWGDVPIHPDEVFQYGEPAHRLVHGYGIITWEWIYGIRSWFIPLGIAGLLVVAETLGIEGPAAYGLWVKGVFCALSLVLPWGMYRLAQAFASETVAIAALLAGCFWHHFLYMAPKPMPGILAAYGLVWLCVLMLGAPGRGRLVAAGVLSGLIFMVRYQLVPVLGILNLLMLVRLRARVGWVLLGNLISLGVAAILDLVFLGGFLSSYIDNFRLNFSYDISSVFGRAGPLYLSILTAKETLGLIAVAVLGGVLAWRRLWPFGLAIVAGYLAFHIPAHKEFRFVIWVIPFAAIAVALLLDHLPKRALAPATLALTLWAVGATGYHAARYVGALTYNDAARHGLAVLRVIGARDTVTGVRFDTPGMPWFRTGGYYALHREVPIYFSAWHDQAPEAVRATRLDHISHVVVEAGATPPEGFDPIHEAGSYTVYETRAQTLDPGLAGYDLRTPLSPALPEVFEPLGRKVPLLTDPTPPPRWPRS